MYVQFDCVEFMFWKKNLTSWAIRKTFCDQSSLFLTMALPLKITQLTTLLLSCYLYVLLITCGGYTIFVSYYYLRCCTWRLCNKMIKFISLNEQNLYRTSISWTVQVHVHVLFITSSWSLLCGPEASIQWQAGLFPFFNSGRAFYNCIIAGFNDRF